MTKFSHLTSITIDQSSRKRPSVVWWDFTLTLHFVFSVYGCRDRLVHRSCRRSRRPYRRRMVNLFLTENRRPGALSFESQEPLNLSIYIMLRPSVMLNIRGSEGSNFPVKSYLCAPLPSPHTTSPVWLARFTSFLCYNNWNYLLIYNYYHRWHLRTEISKLNLPVFVPEKFLQYPTDSVLIS